MKLIGAGFIVAGAICAGTSFLDKPGFNFDISMVPEKIL
jgi:hypothetical protein